MNRFLCSITNSYDDHEIFATTYAEAAEKFCAAYNAQHVEWPTCRDVTVIDPSKGTTEIFEVSCVPEPTYRAKRKRNNGNVARVETNSPQDAASS